VEEVILAVPFVSWLHLLLPSSSIARGLRQGDVLSPIVFIVVMDALGLLFNRAEEEEIQSQHLPIYVCLCRRRHSLKADQRDAVAI
jgi:hypothetical protein